MDKKIILYIILGIIILALILFTLFPGMIYTIRDSGITGGSSTEDKCQPAPGYTEAEWKEHMSHHPDIYKKCLS